MAVCRWSADCAAQACHCLNAADSCPAAQWRRARLIAARLPQACEAASRQPARPRARQPLCSRSTAPRSTARFCRPSASASCHPRNADARAAERHTCTPGRGPSSRAREPQRSQPQEKCLRGGPLTNPAMLRAPCRCWACRMGSLRWGRIVCGQPATAVRRRAP